MTNRVGLLITLVAVALLVTSSVAVSTIALERPLEIEVVDDDSATVGFEAHEPTENGSAADILTVTNRGETELIVDDVELVGTNASVATTPSEIDPGTSATISADVSCGDEFSIEISVTGDRVTVDRTLEDITVVCGD